MTQLELFAWHRPRVRKRRVPCEWRIVSVRRQHEKTSLGMS